MFLSLLGIAVSVLTLVMAFAFGRRVERIGAMICVLGGLFTTAAQAVAAGQLPHIAFLLTVDVGMAVAFGVLALSFPEKLWPGVAAVAQTMLIVFTATRALDFPLSPGAYTAAMNLSALAVSLSLAAGVVSERWGRRRPNDSTGMVARPSAG